MIDQVLTVTVLLAFAATAAALLIARRESIRTRDRHVDESGVPAADDPGAGERYVNGGWR